MHNVSELFGLFADLCFKKSFLLQERARVGDIIFYCKTLLVSSPVGRLPVGIILASGTNNVRILSQFLFCLAGPLITSYTAATIASGDEISFGSAGILSVSAVAFIVVQNKKIDASIIIFFMTLNFVQGSYCCGIYYSIHKSGFSLFTLSKFFV